MPRRPAAHRGEPSAGRTPHDLPSRRARGSPASCPCAGRATALPSSWCSCRTRRHHSTNWPNPGAWSCRHRPSDVHILRCRQVGPVYGGALRPMDRSGISVRKLVVVSGIKGDAIARVELDGQPMALLSGVDRPNMFERAETAVSSRRAEGRFAGSKGDLLWRSPCRPGRWQCVCRCRQSVLLRERPRASLFSSETTNLRLLGMDVKLYRNCCVMRTRGSHSTSTHRPFRRTKWRPTTRSSRCSFRAQKRFRTLRNPRQWVTKRSEPEFS